MKPEIKIVRIEQYDISHCAICEKLKILRYAAYLIHPFSNPENKKTPDGFICADCAVREKL